MAAMKRTNVSERCMRGDCSAPARWLVGLRFWAQGHATDSHPPVEATLGLTVCVLHGPLTALADVISDQGKRQIEAAIKARGREMPDWSTAEIVLRPVDAAFIRWMRAKEAS